MADIKLKVKIEGLDRVQAKLRKDKLYLQPVQRMLERAARLIELSAKTKAPVDTGRLRASIGFNIRPMQAIIAPKVHYGAYVEFGTRPHWPPLAAMQPWAVRHGFPAGRTGAFLLARAISKHGTRPQPYMMPAAEENKPEIRRLANDAAREIETRWRHG